MQAVGSQGARRVFATLLSGISVALSSLIAEAQLVADGATNVLDGVTTNLSGDVKVGTNGSYTLLVLTNGATVTNTGTGWIGWAATANSNAVVITGPGSVWSNATCSVGGTGSYNQLSVINGGVMSDVSAILGNNTGSNNFVLISGAGSRWSNVSALQIGIFGGGSRGNQLLVSDGAGLSCGLAVIGLGSGNGNSVTVTGTGTVWTCSTVNINSGSHNQVVVADSAGVSNSQTLLVGSSGNSNLVLVTDHGTVFRNNSFIQLGSGGKGNQMVVSNGAVVIATYTYVATNGGSQQKLIITGAGSLLTNQNDFYLGQTGLSNQLFVSNGGRLADNSGYIGSVSGFDNNQAIISGPGTSWTNRSNLYVGESSSRNQLIVSNGAKVFNSFGVIGYNPNFSPNSNIVVVTDSGSAWTNTSALSVGGHGSFNQLFVTNGGVVVSGYGSVGGDSNSRSNRVVIADPGSLWKTLINFSLGVNMGGGNQLTVGNGAALEAFNLTVGSVTPATAGNTMDVNGGTVIVTNSYAGSTFLVGYYGTLNLNSGLIRADSLSFDVGNNTFNFRGGTLQTRGTFAAFAGSIPLVVGDGTHSATFELLSPSSASHRFNYGLVISSNATLKGVGTISGNVTISAGGTFSPGSSIGQILLNGSLALNDGSTNCMELNANTGMCDTLVGITNLTYGGTLVVTNIGGALVDGSSFRLFTASNYSGAFSTIIPASPGPGLKWNTNELNVDGVLRVFALQTPVPGIASVQVSSGSVQIQATGGIPYDPCYLQSTTNIASPNSWEIWSTNVFDASGNTTFTPPIFPGERSRFFRLQVN